MTTRVTYSIMIMNKIWYHKKSTTLQLGKKPTKNKQKHERELPKLTIFLRIFLRPQWVNTASTEDIVWHSYSKQGPDSM